MEFKKWMLVLVLILGLTSCSSDDAQEENPPEVVYADVKPTQTKYKAFYGQKLTTNLTLATSRSAETSPNTEMIKPVSVIFYPRTQTISFSNIFDNKTVEYKVTAITNNTGVSVIYNFKINETTFTCTITEKTASTPANVVITFTGGFYKFDLTDSAKKNIAKLVSKITSRASYNNSVIYSAKYTYADTLVTQYVRTSYNEITLEDVVSIVDYSYEGSKLVKRVTRAQDGSLIGTSTFEYENNLITKETVISPSNTKRINTYEYDKQGRITAIYNFYSSGTGFNVRFHSYEKNKMTTIYTDSKDSYYDVETSIYDSDRKPFLISQDQILEPFIILHITKSTSITREGQIIDYGDSYFEYSADGLLIKKTEVFNGETLSVTVREYVEE